MSHFIIAGGAPLSGEVTIAGNKNAALPIIAATVLTDSECVIENMPDIRDVDAMLEILADLGKSVERKTQRTVRISGAIDKSQPDEALVSKLRASILYLGALLARVGEAELAPPGGCVIGRRGVESHFEALVALGAKIESDPEQYAAKMVKVHPAHIFLSEPSVTATENAMLLAAAIPGETVIENAACEPHVGDLGEVLEKMGAQVKGIGTNRLSIHGATKLAGFTHRIVPDHIEAGTFAIAAACTKGELVIRDVRPDHLHMAKYSLRQTGIELDYFEPATMAVKLTRLKAPARKIQVGTWPGFPTDLMSPMIVLATQTEGTTLCHDWMYESRMFFIDKLIAMGAQITLCDPHRVLVSGPTPLRGQRLSSPDIRAGIALVIAALAAKGTSTIGNAELIDRGYENIVERLSALGARIERKA
jgi:UDP-N-acetylglucosamine 1-carboxyvinyltransferase